MNEKCVRYSSSDFSNLRLQVYTRTYNTIYEPLSEACWSVDTSCQRDRIILQDCRGSLSKNQSSYWKVC